MSPWRRLLVSVFAISLALMFVPATGSWGDQSVDLNALLSDPGLSEAGAQDLVAANPGVPFTLSSYDQCPTYDTNKPATFRNVQYKTYADGATSKTLYLDEYYPPTIGDEAIQYTLMILVHGGGYWRSCKDLLQPVAWEASGHVPNDVNLSHYYIVLNIETRLACNPDDPNLEDSPILRMCGWPFTRAEDQSGLIGGTIHDVQDAVEWVTDHWQYLEGRPVSSWNHRIVLLGGSSGGTMVFSSVAPAPEVGGSVADQVDAVAAWSPSLRLDLTEDGNWPCDEGESVSPNDCIRGESWYYLNCQSSPTHEYPDPVCDVDSSGYLHGVYTQASPLTFFTSSSLPHAFFANAGGPYEGGASDHPELVSLQSAVDFEGQLTRNGWHQGTEFDFCIVDNPAVPDPPHGRSLRRESCDYPVPVTETVWQRTADFLE